MLMLIFKVISLCLQTNYLQFLKNPFSILDIL